MEIGMWILNVDLPITVSHHCFKYSYIEDTKWSTHHDFAESKYSVSEGFKNTSIKNQVKLNFFLGVLKLREF